MAAEKPEIVRKAEILVAEAMCGRDASHDAAHAFRVRDVALSLAKEEALSPSSLEIVRIHSSIFSARIFSYFCCILALFVSKFRALGSMIVLQVVFIVSRYKILVCFTV